MRPTPSVVTKPCTGDGPPMTRAEIRLMVRRVLSFVVNTLRGITGDTAIMRIKAAILAGAMALGTSAASAQGPIVAANNLVNVQVGSIQIIDDVAFGGNHYQKWHFEGTSLADAVAPTMSSGWAVAVVVGRDCHLEWGDAFRRYRSERSPGLVLGTVAYMILLERKVASWTQDRIGPNRVGPWGILQPFADLFKFIFKEDLVPDKSTKFVYYLAPIVAVTAALIPIGAPCSATYAFASAGAVNVR